jgi:hypothetical protein
MLDIAVDIPNFQRKTCTMQLSDLSTIDACFSLEIGYVNGYVKHLAQSKA